MLERARHIYGPWRDFLIFGGASLLVLPLLLVWQEPVFVPTYVASVVLLNFANHPHFAYSYQMFYSRFLPSLKDPAIRKGLKLRYISAGVVIPLAMAAFFAFCIVRPDTGLLPYALYLMTMTVGWHYVKQGYGILIVDSVFKKSFFSVAEKRLLFWNAIICWIFSFFLFNRLLTDFSLWDVHIRKLPLPDIFFQVFAVLAAASSLSALTLLGIRLRGSRALLSGILAYVAAIYVWLIGLFHPLLAIIIPFFHSLQYLGMVWRYNANRIGAEEGDEKMRRGAEGYRRFLNFLWGGVLVGYAGFWFLPGFFDRYVPYAKSVFGDHLFLFIFWVFINVHHYFIDNVIWRSDNPEVRAHLFS